MQADKILKLVRLTEKSNKLSSELGQYTFEVFGQISAGVVTWSTNQLFDIFSFCYHTDSLALLPTP